MESVEHHLDVGLAYVLDEGNTFSSRIQDVVLEPVQYLDAAMQSLIPKLFAKSAIT